MSRVLTDRLFTGLVWSVAVIVAFVFCWLLLDLLRGGLETALSWDFLSAAPRDAGRAGGIAPILVSTLLLLFVTLLTSVPLGLGTAILLSEFAGRKQGWFPRLVRRSLDVLAGVPSIVFGLFGNAFFCIYLGMGFSILSGGLTLACMVLPILIRSAEESLRAVPDDYRQAAAALGVSRSAALAQIIVPAAIPGLLVGLVLGIGRALAETAALIFTSGYVDRFPESVFDSGRSLSIHIYDLAMNVPGGSATAYGTTLVLLSLLFLINAATILIGSSWQSRRMVGPL